METVDPKTVDHNELNAETRDGVWTRCHGCDKEFRILFHEYGKSSGGTLLVSSCLSAGVYSIEVACPHCKHEETIL